MKQNVVWILVGVLVIALAGLTLGQLYHDTLTAEDFSSEPIGYSGGTSDYISNIECHVNGVQDMPHRQWVGPEGAPIMMHPANLDENEGSTQEGEMNCPSSTLYRRTYGDNDTPGYSQFKLYFPW